MDKQFIVSARKYRPGDFSTLIGQDSIATTLINSIKRDQISHSYLFCGPRGVGKTTTARIFAKMLNCEHPGENYEPCGECESCLSFAENRSFSIHEMDAASNNGVDDIKILLEKVMLPPAIGKYSVYIIDEVHMLTTAAFNAFLKTLEEPPAHAIFILATTEKHKIPATILSRCQTYDFNRISIENIVKNLTYVAEKEGITIDEESKHVIARKADGAMRDALTIFDQCVAFCASDGITYSQVIENLNFLDYDYSFKFTEYFLSGNYRDAFLAFDSILSKGFSAQMFISALLEHFRNLSIAQAGGADSLLEVPQSVKDRYAAQARTCDPYFVFTALTALQECAAGYRASLNPRLLIEFTLMKLSYIVQKPAQTIINQAPASPAAQSVPAPQPAAQATSAPAASAQAEPAIQSQPAAAPEPELIGQSLQSEAPRRKTRAERQAELSGMTSSLLAVPEPKTLAQPKTASEAAVADDDPVALVMEPAKPAAPSEEKILTAWKAMSLDYTAKTNLYSMLTSGKLELSTDDEGRTLVIFYVENSAQKEWLYSRMHKEFEEKLCKHLSYNALRIIIEVKPAEQREAPKPYLPEAKAADLISKSENARMLVETFNLEVK